MNKYELTIVLDGKATPAKIKTVTATVEKLVNILKGKLGKKEEWGQHPMTYKIGKSTAGYFIHFPLELDASSLKAFNLKLKMESDIIRYLIVRSN